MKNRCRNLKSNSSGQLLLVAALAIALLVSSTTVYVYELSKETNADSSSPITDFVFALKQSVFNTMIGSLANISDGGEKTVLAANLNELSEVVRSLKQFGITQMGFSLLNDSVYDSGVRLSWNTSGVGISSVYADFTVSVHGMATNVTTNYAVNVTTTITIDGSFISLSGDEKSVNLTCRVYNEGEPALFKNVTIFYENLGSWTPVNSSNNLSIMDYGNGTYTMFFTVNAPPVVPSDSIQVSVNIYDTREILVQANTTCYES